MLLETPMGIRGISAMQALSFHFLAKYRQSMRVGSCQGLIHKYMKPIFWFWPNARIWGLK